MREAAFEAGGAAQLVVEANGTLLMANELARQMFALAPRDLGRPIQDVELSYRPVELRSLIEQAITERRPATLKDVDFAAANGSRYVLDVQVNGLFDNGGPPVGALVVFTDVTRYKRLQEELQ